MVLLVTTFPLVNQIKLIQLFQKASQVLYLTNYTSQTDLVRTGQFLIQLIWCITSIFNIFGSLTMMQQISSPKKIVGIHSGYHKTASDNKMIFVKFH